MPNTLKDLQVHIPHPLYLRLWQGIIERESRVCLKNSATESKLKNRPMLIRNPESGIQVILVCESGNHGFGIWNPANEIRNPTLIVIQNPGCWLWNPESMDVENGIHSVESGIQDSLGLPYMGREKPYLL